MGVFRGEIALFGVKSGKVGRIEKKKDYLCMLDIRMDMLVTQTKKNHIPSFLRGKYQLIASVTFTALFSLVFMLVSIPYSHNAWFALDGSQAFAFTALFYIISLLTIILSRRIMYALRAMPMTYLQYVLWIVGETLLVCLLYAIFTVQGDRFGIINLQDRSFGDIYMGALAYAFVSLVIPAIIAGMYFTIIDKNNTIRLMNYRNVVSDQPIAPKDEQKVTLFDNNGVLKMVVSLENLYYIEANDNYVIVWYTDSKGQLTKYMLRCRLRTLEESFSGSPLVRGNRSCIVNMGKVKVLRKGEDGYVVELENDATQPVPVTKTYAANVLAVFNATK